ncbi:MAG TPA: NUDIX domain-containing protein [Patescibacteria group bacterium]|nr:NUDIX domain-containing protein [Patescibacteria group bacterium]
MPREYSLEFHVDNVPPVMRRKRHVLLVLKDQEGKYVLGGKNEYPKGIVRFIGGGIHAGEDPARGAVRELEEELRIVVPSDKLEHLATIQTTVQTERETLSFTVYLFFLALTDQELHPSDDVDTIARLDQHELNTLISNFYHLPTDLVHKRPDEESFRWSTYGELFGKIHEIGRDLSQ